MICRSNSTEGVWLTAAEYRRAVSLLRRCWGGDVTPRQVRNYTGKAAATLGRAQRRNSNNKNTEK